MDNKLSELSKPAAFIVRSPLGDVAYRTISQADADYIAARKGYISEPLYSQEYVSALLEEMGVRERSLISNCVDYEYDLIEMKRRAEAAEQRVSELEQAMKEQAMKEQSNG